MRTLVAVALAAVAASLALPAMGQTCTTTISGVIHAPNGSDPLPNVLVFLPTVTPAALTPGIACPVPGTLPSGAPFAAGGLTGTDGKFQLDVSSLASLANVPLVAQAGKWRRQTTLSGLIACQDNPVDPDVIRMPKNQSEGDIPLIAIATGSADEVECVLHKAGVDNAEFTNPGGGGRIHLYLGNNSPGAQISSVTPSENVLMGNQATLNQYDVLMLPCEGGEFNKNSTQLAHLVAYANAGGRVYASHFSYDWMYRNPPLDTVVKWNTSSRTTLPNSGASGTATIDISFAGGQTLAQWLQLVGATTTPGQIPLAALKNDQSGVNPPTQSWMTLNSTGSVMQFTFNAPVGVTNQCGRVLFDEYHVENPTSVTAGKNYPAECPSSTTMTPQEKLLEFTLFDLTGSGGAPTMTPNSADFGSQPIRFPTAAKTFTWTNNAIFPLHISSVTASGDFSVASTNCIGSVPANTSCAINAVFTPTALGPETGTLTVVSSSNTLTASLAGTGTPDLTAADSTSVSFGNQDVGSTSAAKTVVWTNATSGPVAVPAFSIIGDFAIAGSNCPSTLAAGATCNISITFKPTATGGRTGTFTTSSADPAYSGLQTALAGNGVDFTIAIAPSSDSVIAGKSVTPTLTLTPSTGYSNNVTLSCTAPAAGSACSIGSISLLLSSTVSATMQITTVSQYEVIGYGGTGGRLGLLWLLAMGSGGLLWMQRRRTRMLLRAGLFALLLAVGALGLSGCNGHLPSANSPYTAPGTYAYTVTATDGTVTHSATYSLTVTVR